MKQLKKHALVFLDSDDYVAYKIFVKKSDISKAIEVAVKVMQIENDRNLAQWFQAREHNRVIFEVTDMIKRAEYSCSEVNRFGKWFITI